MIRSLHRFGRAPDITSYNPVGPQTSPVWIAVGASGDTGAAPAYGTNIAGDMFGMLVTGRMTSLTTPAGWTLQGGPNDQGGRRCYLLTRDARSTGGESGTVAITAAGASFLATIHTFRNVALASFVESVALGGRNTNGNGPLPPPGNVSGGSITVTQAHRLAVFGHGDGEQIALPASIVATGGTWTRRYQEGTETGTNCSAGLYTFDFGGSVGTITGGDGGVTTNEHSIVGFALVGI